MPLIRSRTGIGLLLALLLPLAGCEVSDEPVLTAEGEAARPIPAAQFDLPRAARPQQPALVHPTEQVPLAKGNLRFVQGYRQGYDQALREGKPMMLFFTAKWCHFCHQMAGEAFTDRQVVNLSERFVCVLVDADAEPAVCKQFAVRNYPTIQFVSSRGEQLNRIVGKQPTNQLVREMHSALQAVARNTSREQFVQ